MKKFRFLITILLAILFALPLSDLGLAAKPGEIWTTTSSCLEQQTNFYDQGDTVHIRLDDNFADQTLHYWKITDEPGKTFYAGSSVTVNYDGEAYFCFPAWVIPNDAVAGQYKAWFSPQSTFPNSDSSTKTFGIEEKSQPVLIDASISISQFCELDDLIERVTISLTGITSVTIAPPSGGGPAFTQTLSSATYTNFVVGTYGLSNYVFAEGYKAPDTPLPNQFIVEDCDKQQDIDASISISGVCELDDLIERVTISLTGITSVTITPPSGGGPSFTLTLSSYTYTDFVVGTYGLSDYVFAEGYKAPDAGLPRSFIVEACDEKQEPTPSPTPEPTIAPTTGSPDSFIGMIVAASSALLISGTSFTLWFKKQQD